MSALSIRNMYRTVEERRMEQWRQLDRVFEHQEVTCSMLRDITDCLYSLMGAEAYNAWAPAQIGNFRPAAEAKLFEMMGVRPRLQWLCRGEA